MKADTQYTITNNSKFKSLEMLEYRECKLLNALIPKIRKQVKKEGRNKLIVSSSFSVLIYAH